MFYGAFDFETAFAETFDPDEHAGAIVSAATFRPVRELHILDLANLPDVPSIYDEDRNYLIHPMRFLHSFANDISKPIKRDGKEHIEYVPTQIVTEYFRKIFEGDGGRVDGISYRSSKTRAGAAFVLFFENEHCFEGEPTGREQDVLQLVGVTHSVATADQT